MTGGSEWSVKKSKNLLKNKISKSPSTTYPCPPIQIIILDEADSMTVDAQSALRRTIEIYSTSTRFCIICNYVSKIISPLSSRCLKFRFTPISPASQTLRLTHILSSELIPYKPSVIPALISLTSGDLRKSIMLLQSACKSYTDK